MTRAQCIVERDKHILMVKHRVDGEEYWCLPGGGVEALESPVQAALRELEEECHVRARLIRQTGRSLGADGMETVTFWVDIGAQEPVIGSDPEFAARDPILVDMQWLTLAQIPERDRAYLWAANLMSIPAFLDEVSSWGDALSYPVE